MAASDVQNPDNSFTAFISYAHRDGRSARWLHRAIETYRLPRALANAHGGSRIGRVFLDRSELATSSSLSERIEEALTNSRNLLVVCSPAARQSRWVNEEVRRFRGLGRGDRIFCLIVDGDPARDDEEGCFPAALLEATSGHPRPEPLAADIRPGADRLGDARLKLVAGLIDVPFDALKRRDAARRQRLLAIVAGVSVALLAVMAVLTTFALISRAEAVRQRAEALRQRDTQERTSGFLQEIFFQASPSQSGGKETTLRHAIDAAAARALQSAELAREPELKANLLIVLAEVYAKMGLGADARRLIDAARALPWADPQTQLMLLSQDAGLRLWASDLTGLRQVLHKAFAVLAANPQFPEYRPQLLGYRAQLSQAEGDNAAAIRDWEEVRRWSQTPSPRSRENRLLALLGEGVAAVDNGQPERGAPLLRRVVAERQAMGEPLHPQALSAITTLGAVEIKLGHPVAAEQWFRRAERLQLQIYGQASQYTALTRSNLGRALVEQRRFGEAARTLETARTALIAQAGDEVDTLANLEDSLGLARGGLGQSAAARAAFTHGLAVARKHEMPKQVELLADRAELECRAGDAAAGLPLVAEARATLARFALPEPWRAGRLDAVEGGCLLATGRAAAARPLLARALPLVVARWGGNSLFGRSVREDARRAGVSP